MDGTGDSERSLCQQEEQHEERQKHGHDMQNHQQLAGAKTARGGRRGRGLVCPQGALWGGVRCRTTQCQEQYTPETRAQLALRILDLWNSAGLTSSQEPSQTVTSPSLESLFIITIANIYWTITACHRLPHLIPRILWDKYSYHPHVTNREPAFRWRNMAGTLQAPPPCLLFVTNHLPKDLHKPILWIWWT